MAETKCQKLIGTTWDMHPCGREVSGEGLCVRHLAAKRRSETKHIAALEERARLQTIATAMGRDLGSGVHVHVTWPLPASGFGVLTISRQDAERWARDNGAGV